MPAKATRAAFGEALLDLGARDERIVTLDADLSKSTMPTPVRRLGVTGFGESGDPKALYAKHGLDAAGITASVRKFLGR